MQKRATKNNFTLSFNHTVIFDKQCIRDNEGLVVKYTEDVKYVNKCVYKLKIKLAMYTHIHYNVLESNLILN